MNDNQSSRMSLGEALQMAVGLHGRGELQRAEQIYRQILSVNPKQPDALHLLGVIALQTGNAASAVDLIGQALDQDPDNADALANLGNAQQEQNDLAGAENSYRRALELRPQSAETRSNLANTLMKQGKLDEAVEEYRSAIQINPRMPQTHRSLGMVLHAQGRFLEALSALNQAHQLDPKSVETKGTIGNVLQELGRPEEAVQFFRQVLAALPTSAPAHMNLANSLRSAGETDEAIELLERAVALDPENSSILYNKGVALKDKGQFEAATDHLRQSISLQPSFGQAHRLLAMLKKHEAPDADMAAMQRLLESDSQAAAADRAHAAFGLGKAQEDLKNYDEAFEYYRMGNTLWRDLINYDLAEDRDLFNSLANTFTANLFEQAGETGIASASPIFIVGMPRSGTTLVEQILASHSTVFGGGELSALTRAIASQFKYRDGIDYAPSVGNADRAQFARAAEFYLAETGKLAPDGERVTDKMPMNFQHVGMIRLMFPNAVVIHTRRSPEDTCLSNYKNFFAANGHLHTYDLEELGQYYNLYRELMAHWDRVLPGFVYHLDYEELIADQEAQTKALLKRCGLDWEPACLDFHKTERNVSTISATQVRQPMYKSAVERWRRYEDRLGPLLKILHEDSVGR